MISIMRWDRKKIIHEGEFFSVRECLEDGVKRGISFDYAKLNEAQLNGAKLNDAKLNYAKLNEAQLNYAELNGAKLNGAKLNRAELNFAELDNAKLNEAKLNRAELNGAKLNRAELSRAELNGADLDFSSYPLYCGSLRIRKARRLFCQLAYHLATFTDIDDKDIQELKNSCLFKKVANKFTEYRTEMEKIV